ncbi:MAG: CDP-diacylglycerol--glycerol-3-phosphate 3-phosphatidyltransferase [Alphaproteobacteria bacterium]|nr:CDP-diacylglycerol--glycerol-3-phosphate 3-phosphatidyltransferase [Alphaproteobacteria bacterium]
MLCIPVVVALLWDRPSFIESQLAFWIFIGAMITDIIDGYLARKWDLVSPLGAYLDPMADKLMVQTVLIMMVPLGWVPAWLVAVLLGREIAITGLRGIASQEGITIKASSLGKAKTAYQSTAIGFMLWGTNSLDIDHWSAGIVLLYVATGVAVVSGGEYFVSFVRNSKRFG